LRPGISSVRDCEDALQSPQAPPPSAEGNEAAIFKAVVWHSIVLVSLVGGIVMLYAYVIPWLIP